jgi:pilus assembly protein CpaD
MSRKNRFASVALTTLLAPVALGGCSAIQNDERLMTYAGWQQLAEAPPPRVEQVPVRHLVRFLPGAEAMTATDRVALAGFLASNNIGRGGQVGLSVVDPSAPDGARAASHLSAVAATLNRMGVATIAQPATHEPAVELAGAQSDDVAVVAYKLAVLPQPCPGYTMPVTFDTEHRPLTAWGCSTAANLGMMVANPADLIEGRAFGPADGEAATLAIQRYRKGEITPLVKESTSE